MMTLSPVLIVGHGQPSDPAPAAQELASLADQVGAHFPPGQIHSVTLAEPEGLAGAVQRLGPFGMVFPMFMAGGWFTKVNLPKKLAEVGGDNWRVAEPFGEDPAVLTLCLEILREAGIGAGDEVLLAAHGSFRSPAPSQIANRVAEHLQRELGLARCQAAFIDQSPKLADAVGFSAQAVCLPFFAAKGGHVIDDVPQALAEAGFSGRVLPPIGLDARAPALIARAIKRGLVQDGPA